jgi:hypothetical protein
MVNACVSVGFPFGDQPTVNSQDELTVAACGSHNLKRRSNCNFGAWSFPLCATPSPSAGGADIAFDVGDR